MSGIEVLYALAFKAALIAIGAYFLWRAYDAFRFQLTGKSKAEQDARTDKISERASMLVLGMLWLLTGLTTLFFGVTVWR